MKRILLLLLLVFFIYEGYAQELITDRPDQTESSSVVPLHRAQIESGFAWENKKTENFKHSFITVNSTLLRYGILENMEIRVGMEYLYDHYKNLNRNKITNADGIGPLYAGFKIKLIEEKGYVPEIAFIGAIILPFMADEEFKTPYSSTSYRFAFSHTFSEKVSLGYNLGAEWDGETAVPGYIYSVALGIGLTDKLGTFIESYGTFFENGHQEHLADAGFTYLLEQNLQLDLSAGIGLNEDPIDYFVSFGFSYLFDEK